MVEALVSGVVGLAVGITVAALYWRGRMTNLEAQLGGERRRYEDGRRVWDEATARLRDMFQALAGEALRGNNQAFLDLATTSLREHHQAAAADLEVKAQAVRQLVEPVARALDAVQEQVRAVEKERVGAYSALDQHLATMAQSQDLLRRETSTLVRALRTPAVRGRWGEMQLRRVVELAGMVEYCDFEQQVSVSTDDGRLRPDLIVRLPGGRTVIVDAKTPLDAYLGAMECPSDGERDARLRDHARQVRDHAAGLAAKAYWEQFQDTPEFVVLFLPGESFFSAALQYDPGLIEVGAAQKVILATPTTLIALLKAVAYGWRQERVAESAMAVSELGRELYERLCVWVDHFRGVGKNLDEAVSAYNRSVASLEGRVLVSARRLTDLGVSAERTLAEVEPVERDVRKVTAMEQAVERTE